MTTLTKPTIPFSEAPWISGLPSPYFKESHKKLREFVRRWTDQHLFPNAARLEESGKADPKIYAQAAKDGLLIPFALGAKIPRKLYDEFAEGIKLPAGIEPEEWDHFHDYVLCDELHRVGNGSAIMSMYGGLAYGAGPIVNFASKKLQERFLPDLLTGRKRIALAITEPKAGSNVANLSTTAELTPDGRHFIINGTKKWITNGVWSDYLTTAVRTSGKAGDSNGITFIIIPVRGPGSEGVELKQMKMTGSSASGTTFVDFDQVKVPRENVIGKEGEALKYIFYNFNHERMTIAIFANRYARVCLEDAIAHSIRREVFGKKLIENPVVRYEIGHMARQVESLQAWIEMLLYQQNNLTVEQANVLTGGQTAALKAHAGIVLENVCSGCTQLLGGLGLTRGGTGARIEQIWREVKAFTIPGGSASVMIDLAVRQQLKLIQSLAQEGRKSGSKL
ncbi:acyl-CoA dehydrogenase NM domain-like protein [Tilletiaria anomala UBC 951]|uniref:Acyl-CoA dehydrogenase NM domain-like protein n=1 Tax=Tilletiaria anomala (strain ATCC 24038 / CBS 436.72 / UBC 951) TaxID=1037660 RepID=A0A066WDV5_TILAU|nr:acyl-CoA dehydrogenase NM domain-like protein [Tilletiaria anomala UBC 951]KDN52137.1 acyl-CoA dehydrogenase NM domain-like protein [Tilletiaria anomala UBC 951]